MVFALFLVLAFVFLWRKPTQGLKQYDLPALFLFKIVLGWLFMYIYSRIYGVGAETVDWEEFIHDSVVLRNVAFEDFGVYLRFLFGFSNEADVQQYLMHTNHWAAGDLALMNDSRNVLRINSLIAFLFNGNVYYHIGFISLFVVLGFRELYNAFQHQVWLKRRWFWWILVLFPSTAFWTASMLKEPFMIIGLCLLFAALFGKYKKTAFWWRLLLGLVLLIGFKPYVFLCLIVPCLLFALRRWGTVSLYLSYTVLTIVVIAGIFAFPNWRNKAVHQLTRMQFDFANIGRGGVHVVNGENFYYFAPEQLDEVEILGDSLYVKEPLTAKLVTTGMKLPFADVKLTSKDGPWVVYFTGIRCGSYMEITPINSSFTQLIRNAPEALVNASFRPFPTDNGGWLKLLNFLETILLFGFLVYSLFAVSIKRSPEQQRIAWTLFVFALLLLLLIGWTTPVLGALVRYRIPAYLALLLIAVLGTKRLKWK